MEWKPDGKVPVSVRDQRSALRDKLARRLFRPEINAAALAAERYRLESEVEPPTQSEAVALRARALRRQKRLDAMLPSKRLAAAKRALDPLGHRTRSSQPLRSSKPSKLKK